MNNIKRYNLFIFTSTLSRSILEIFSSLLLYKKGYSIKEILTFFSLLYFVGIFTSYFSLNKNEVHPRRIILLSTMLFSISFILFNIMQKNIVNLLIFSVLFSISSYTYHSMRHYLAINTIDRNNSKQISNILLISYLATIISSYFSLFITKRLGLYIVVIISVILSLISLLSILKLKSYNEKQQTKLDYYHVLKMIPIKSKLFFFLEQFKVIFLSLQPVYLYLYINKNIEYIGLFNTLVSITILIISYLILNKKNINKYFFLLNTLFVLVLILKINITNQIYILIIAIFEGIGIKIYENYSLENIYNNSDNINTKSYLIISETIFCLTRSFLCLIFIFISNLKVILYINIIGIFISGIISMKKNSIKISFK